MPAYPSHSTQVIGRNRPRRHPGLLLALTGTGYRQWLVLTLAACERGHAGTAGLRLG
jgi:hypothetical protein